MKNWETYNGDEIHMFRRVHIKMRTPNWSQENRGLGIVIQSVYGYAAGSVIFRNMASFGVANQKPGAVHCNKPFDRAFCYFEICFRCPGSGIEDNL